MTTARKRRAYAPRVPPQERRTQLLDAALHLVVARGHAATTMDAVAEQAGVTKPVVYGVFGNRAELLAALLEREQQGAVEQFFAALPEGAVQRAAADPAGALADMLDGLLTAVRAAPERWYCVVMPMADMPPEFHAAREAARAVAMREVEKILQAVLPSLGAPPELDSEILAHTVVTLFDMAARLVLTDPAHFRPERFVSALRAAVALAAG